MMMTTLMKYIKVGWDWRLELPEGMRALLGSYRHTSTAIEQAFASLLVSASLGAYIYLSSSVSTSHSIIFFCKLIIGSHLVLPLAFYYT